MKTETRTVYIIDDGEEFKSAAEAELHEAQAAAAASVESYIGALALNSERERSRVRNVINGWLRHAAQQSAAAEAADTDSSTTKER